jgi:hypothetical protein
MIPGMLAAVRKEWRRGLALAFALWFAALSVSLPMLHTCPTSDGGSSASAAHGGHGARATGSGDTENSSRHSGHASDCSCLGQCCASSTTTLPAPTPPATIAGVTVDGESAVSARFDAPTAWPGFVLPFATAPPLG